MRLDAGSMSDLCASVCILIDSVFFFIATTKTLSLFQYFLGSVWYDV